MNERKNYFEIRKNNQVSLAITQFLHWSKCDSLDELVSLDLDMIGLLLKDYNIFLRDGLNRTKSTRENKLQCLQLFYKVNGIRVIFTGEDGIKNYFN